MGIVGNNKVKELLKASVDNEQTSHSYLFVGIDGIGKKQIAKEFSKMILCTDEKKYCDKCKSCIEIDGNNNPDLIICSVLEGEKSIKVDQIREIQKSIQEKPIISNNKVIIIDEAHKMTEQAQNCLLKTLEEPPEYATIILIGANENDFLVTIKSRCTIIKFEKISNIEISKYMNENYGINLDNSNMLDVFQGSIGKAILLKDKLDIYKNINMIFENIAKKDIIEIIKMSKILYDSKDEIFDIIEYINVILLKLAKQEYKYTNCIEIVENTKQRLKKNGNYDMCIDNMLFNIWEEVN